MKIINVPDMMCENCVSRITKALTDAVIDELVTTLQKLMK